MVGSAEESEHEIRPRLDSDIPAMAALRGREPEAQIYWEDRIRRYLSGKHSPQQALSRRVAFVAVGSSKVVGFVAGHLTRRYDCDGELQWINVAEEHRGAGIARSLLAPMARWFVEQDARRVCVNVDPNNSPAVRLYKKHRAEQLNDYWMIWEDIRLLTISSPAKD
jgi:ribosomal protein S18 acetylase RimI-like enzyme